MIDIYIAIFTICIFFILLTHFKSSSGAFYLGTSQYSVSYTAVSIVAAFTGGGALINTTSLASTFGNYAFFDVVPSIFGLLLASLLAYIGFFGKRFSKAFFDISSNIYDKKAVTVHYAEVSFLYILVIAAQLRAVATIANQLEIQVWIAVLICCVTVAAYSYRGFDAVTRTDIAQISLMIPLYFVLAYLAFQPIENVQEVQESSKMPLELALSLCLPALFIPISQELHQRGAAVSDLSAKSVMKSYLMAALIYGTLAILSVLAFSKNPDISFGQIISGSNRFAAICIIIGLTAAILSTLDTSTNISAHALQKLKLFKINEASPAFVQTTLLILGAILFLFFDNVLSLILFALFVYMAGPALTFISIYIGIHPKQSAFIGVTFTSLQTFFQFQGGILIQNLTGTSTSFLNNTTLIGISLIIMQLFVLILIYFYRKIR